ncbi:MAG: 3-phosphoshikimate 1-carboxyvinyltransferase [Chloroflexota bacterium]
MTQQTSTLPLPISPLQAPPQASICIPGSKSLTNRVLLIAAMAKGTTTLSNALFSDDSLYLANALQTLGFSVTLDPENTRITVKGLGGCIPEKQADLFIGNAGTAARFLTAFLTLGNGEYTIDGNSRMRERPIGDLVDTLRQLGAKLEASTPQQSSMVSPPLKITASGLSGGRAEISGMISSQYLSALIMVAPYAQTTVSIEVTTKLNSRPYIDLTLSAMSDFGVEIERDVYKQFIVHPARYTPTRDYPIEADASAASYFFAIPALCGGTIRVENINRNSKQGDISFLDVLSKMGCTVTEFNNSIAVTGADEITGIDMDMCDIPDTAQTLAALAPFATTPTRIRGIASARLKETDRVSATCTELKRIGVRVDEHEDGLTIYPCSEFHPATIQTYNDHRMAMAFSMIGLRQAGIKIENPGCVSKTFPNFFEVLETLK